MALAYYFDHNVPRAISEGLALRGIDVLTCLADGTETLEDDQVLDRATELERVLFSMDDDLLREARARQLAGIDFSGVIYAHQLSCSVGRCIDDLEIIAKSCTLDELRGRAEFLPI